MEACTTQREWNGRRMKWKANGMGSEWKDNVTMTVRVAYQS